MVTHGRRIVCNPAATRWRQMFVLCLQCKVLVAFVCFQIRLQQDAVLSLWEHSYFALFQCSFPKNVTFPPPTFPCILNLCLWLQPSSWRDRPCSSSSSPTEWICISWPTLETLCCCNTPWTISSAGSTQACAFSTCQSGPPHSGPPPAPVPRQVNAVSWRRFKSNLG